MTVVRGEVRGDVCDTSAEAALYLLSVGGAASFNRGVDIFFFLGKFNAPRLAQRRVATL
jgi:hypothetical protein